MLETHEFTVEKIEERDQLKTPDFYVTKGEDEYTIELKTKFMNPETVNAMKASFNEGEIHEHAESLDFNTKYQKVIHGAKKQLESEPIYKDSFHLGWFHCEGSMASATMDLFENTLYGKATIIDADNNEDGAGAYECYYYDRRAMFIRYKDVLDGAVITTHDGSIKILLNLYSPNYEALRDSSLCEAFSPGLQDPIARANKGEALFLEEEDDGADRCGILNKKFGMKRAMKMPMTVFNVTMATKAL